jgi:opacity protein-like surface antigen
MTRARVLILGCLGTLAFAAAAHAADPAESWRRPLPEPDFDRPPAYRELMSGWYVRGDLGSRFTRGGPSAANVTSEKYTSTIEGGLGFGYKYQWFRADLTYDFSAPTRVGATTSAATGQPQYTARISTQVLLANAYIDFGTWGGFTPYLGGGVGLSRLQSSNYADTSIPPATGTDMGVGKVQNFAWAAMAGVAYQVTPNWMVDVGVRHLKLGDVSSTAAGAVTTVATFRNLSANEARIGVRYLFD